MAKAPARPPSLIRLAVRCGPQAAERVLAELLALAPNGVEEERGSDWVEYAIYGAPGELPDVGSIQALADGERIEVSSQPIPDDWADRWRDFHEPVWMANGRVVVRPSWTPPPSRPAGIDVIVEPGQAFGTGAHPTTRMCVELLVELADAGEANGALADLGTGSGVLAITAAKLGFSPVIAVDHELPALDAVSANSEANDATVETLRLNLREQPPPATRTAVANLTAPLLRALGEHWKRDGPPRHVVCSGLLAREADDVADALSLAGLRERVRRESGDWAAIRLERG